ncbi:MAG TPA: carboxypeptidase regulatory-like domain-containing protein [Myxococcales bacterium]|nr:carboxypeptidase regulatory-like domain-containing protein [Myxococcales bacterium]
MQRRFGVLVAVILVLSVGWWWLRSSMPMNVPSEERAAQPSPAVTAPAAPERTVVPILRPAIQLAKPVAVRTAPQAAPGRLEGVVLDAATGERIAGAQLTFSHDDGAYSTSTGPGGAFHFAPRLPGTYGLVSVEAKGYSPFESEFGHSPVSFTSVPGKDVSGVVLRLARERKNGRQSRRPRDEADAGEPSTAAALFGRVVDARSRAPVAAFAIALFRRDGVATRLVAPASFIDPSGSYRVDGLSPGTYEVTAMAAGYAWSTYAVVSLADSAVQADFELHAGVRVTGRVVDDSTRRPLSGAEISLEGRRGDTANLPVAPLSPEAESDADGRFVLEHVPPDVNSMSVEKRGYVVRLFSLRDLPRDGDAPPLEIALTPRDADPDARIELTGIGATLRARTDTLQIQQLVANAGAADAGLIRGDQIVAVDGLRVSELGFDRAIGAIRGPEGTTVILRIRRSGTEIDVVVMRKLVRS